MKKRNEDERVKYFSFFGFLIFVQEITCTETSDRKHTEEDYEEEKN